jgi:hypothetical protein
MDIFGPMNNINAISRLWADLLAVDGAPFKNVFSRVVFAVIDTETYIIFRETE